MPQRVNLEGVGDLEFSDDFTPDQIRQTVTKIYERRAVGQKMQADAEAAADERRAGAGTPGPEYALSKAWDATMGRAWRAVTGEPERDLGRAMALQPMPPPAARPSATNVDFSHLDTRLSPEEEQQFELWKMVRAPHDSGFDYDLRGAFKAGVEPDETGHWPDTFKKPNHPTFSDQSIYAKQYPGYAGHWVGQVPGSYLDPLERFVPPPSYEDRQFTQMMQGAGQTVGINTAIQNIAEKAYRAGIEAGREHPEPLLKWPTSKPATPEEMEAVRANIGTAMSQADFPPAGSMKAEDIALAMAGAGKATKAAVADVGLTLTGHPTLENLRAANMEPLRQPLPAEEELAGLDTLQGSAAQGALGAVGSAPAMVAGAALAPVMSPFVSYPLAFGTQTYGETGDPMASLKSGGIAALFPIAGKVAEPMANSLTGRLVTSGVLDAGNLTGQRTVQALVHQATFNAAAQLMNVPEYINGTPEERAKLFAETSGNLLVFAIPDALGIAGASRRQAAARAITEEVSKGKLGDKNSAWGTLLDNMRNIFTLRTTTGETLAEQQQRKKGTPYKPVPLSRTTEGAAPAEETAGKGAEPTVAEAPAPTPPLPTTTKTKEEQDAVQELRPGELSQTQGAGTLPGVGAEIRPAEERPATGPIGATPEAPTLTADQPYVLIAPGEPMPPLAEGQTTFDAGAKGTIIFDPRRISPQAIGTVIKNIPEPAAPPAPGAPPETAAPPGAAPQPAANDVAARRARLDEFYKAASARNQGVMPQHWPEADRRELERLQREYAAPAATAAPGAPPTRIAGVDSPMAARARRAENQQILDQGEWPQGGKLTDQQRQRLEEENKALAEMFPEDPNNHPMVQAARSLVYERFRPDQVRGTPERPDKMTDHLERVAAMVDDPVLKSIAYLHDIIEDTPTTLDEIRQKFGDRVADALNAETWRKDEETYQQYIDRLSFNRDAMQSKLADLSDNLATSLNWGDTEKVKNKRAGWQKAHDQLTQRLKADITPTVVRPTLPDGKPREPWRNEQIEKVAQSASLPPPGHKPKIIFSGGGPGAGKSTIIAQQKEPGGFIHGEMSLTISADDYKTGEDSVEKAGAQGIPEFQTFKESRDPRGGMVVHKESTGMAKKTLARVRELRRDVVYDATMSHVAEDWKLAQDALNDGYNVALLGIAIDPKEAYRRAVKRGEAKHRYVEPDSLLAGHAAWARSFPEYLKLFPEIQLWDNNPRPAKLVLSKGPEGIEIHDPQAYIKFAGEQAYEEAKRVQSEFRSAAERPTAPGDTQPRTDAPVVGQGDGGRGGGGPAAPGERGQGGEGGGPSPGQHGLAGGLTPSRRLADWVQEKLNRGEKFNSAELFRAADEAYGKTQAHGGYNPKDAYDAMEAGINNWLKGLDPNVDMVTARNTISRLKAMLAKLPTQTTRTTESDKLQQFSTPPPFSFLANWVAGIRRGETMLEPSAGIGGLAVFAKNAGAKVIGNELSPRRAALLRETGIADHVFVENAEHLHALLTPKIAAGELPQPTVVVMNPPFSNAARSNVKSNMVGATHVEEALKLLPQGGRLVAILGEGMTDSATSRFAPWWNKIKGQYNLRANVGIEGTEYRKYGTTFGNRLLVIDKSGPTPKDGTVRGQVNHVEDALPLLEDIRNDRPRIEQASVERGGDGTITPREGGGQPEPTAPAPVGAVEPGGQRPTGGDVGGLRPKPGRPKGGTGPSGGGPGAGGRGKPVKVEPPGKPPSESSEAQSGGLTVQTLRDAKRQVKQLGVFTEYRPAKVHVEGAHPPPTKLVESTAMASVEPPDPTYSPYLPLDMIKKGGLSETSLENIIYAGQAHQHLLPDGSRMGYFIGDGTGVGKGRQIAGVFMDNWNQGRKRGLWVSKTPSLINDAKRDFNDIGFDTQRVLDLGKKQGAAIEGDADGIGFITYAGLSKGNPGLDPHTLTPGAQPRLITRGADEKPGRLEKLYKWLGPDFDGVIAFDEAHLAGNAIDVPGKRGPKKASERGKTVVDIQRLFPKARILYVSATGATDVTNLSYADRLGIWGHGTPFPTKQAFFDEIRAGGLSAMEIVARDLKSMGRYMSRTMSFEGVEQRQLPHELTPEQTDTYNEVSRAWQLVFQEVDSAMANSGSNNNGQARQAALSAFYSAQQRFYNTLLTAMQMPSVIADMKAELKKNNSILLQIINTNEAALGRQLADKGTEEGLNLEALDLSPKEGLLQYVDRSFPTIKYEPVTDADGNTRWEPVRDSQGNRVEDPEAVAAKMALLDKIALLKMPGNPLEMITDTFGVENVAEVTGRGKRIVNKLQEDGTRKRVLETSRGPAQRKIEADEFQDLLRRILVFSDAGGTGFSYHASRKVKNQQRRIHYLVQAGWRADAAVQGMGRSHRTDQASAPFYVLPSTNIKGHQRFISTIARRLAELGALTGGERKAAERGLFTEENNLENDYAEDAVLGLFRDLRYDSVPGLDFNDISKKMGYVKRVIDERSGEIKEVNTLLNEGGGLNFEKVPTIQQFLNRVLVLEFAEQNRTFDAFMERLQTRIQNAKKTGTYDPGTQTVKALKIDKLSDQIVYQHPDSTATTRLVETESEHPTAKRSWKDLLDSDPDPVMMVNKRSGRVIALKDGRTVTNENGGLISTYEVRRPNGDVEWTFPKHLLKAENFDPVEGKDRERVWSKEFDATPDTHKRRDTYVVGAFLPIWDRLKLPNPQIWRVPVTGGDEFLGAHVPARSVDALRVRLGATGGAKLTPGQVYADVLQNGKTVTLANGWQLRRVRRSGEERIEVSNVQYNQTRELTDHIGAFMERIGYEPHFYLPLDEPGIEAMRKILDKSPPIAEPPGGPEATHAMEASGGGARAPQRPMTPAPREAPSAPTGEAGEEVEHGFSGTSRGIRQSAADDLSRLRNFVAPQSVGGPGGPARFTANLLRELNARMANEKARVEHRLRIHRNEFDRTPINLRTYRYHPAAPLPRNFAFINAYETGNRGTLPPKDAAAAAQLHQENVRDLARIHALGTGALTKWYQDYFPHLWDDPKKAGRVFSRLLAKAPLEGSKGFLKERTYKLFEEGLKAGLKPVHDNPIDMWLLKKQEIERYIMGVSFVKELKAAGVAKFKYAFGKMPDGHQAVNDRAFSVYGPPTVTIKEAFDAGMRESTLDLMQKLGVPHERLARIGGRRWGYERDIPGTPGTERIVTKFGGPDMVMWHELGHVLHNRYPDLETLLTATPQMHSELDALADARVDATSSASFRRNVRTIPEKMAVALQAYVHAPELMEKTAPTVKAAMESFIKAHPELEQLNEIRPTLRMGEGKAEMTHGGLLKLGDYVLPDQAANVVNNFLSPGLQKHGWYRGLRQVSNLLNSAQLGLSGFHLGFTSLDAATSRLAVALEDLFHGKPLSALKTAASTPFAPLTNIRTGAKLRSEVLRPGSHPEMAQLAHALERAGGRTGMDSFWQTEFTRRMKRAWHAGGLQYGKAMGLAPFAAWEQLMRPILEYVVPRQKLGVFADMAKREMQRLGPNASAADQREAMRKAWDSVDNRMGQVVYDNLFHNKMVKDVALMTFRAYGWQLGKYREGIGAATDTLRAAGKLAKGQRPEFTHRMAYAMALPMLVGTIGGMMHYLFTGKRPDEPLDYFQPETGEVDRNGNPVRLNLPSYVKDAIAYGKHPVTSAAHSLNPMLSGMFDLLQNRDFYNTEIRHPDDPLIQQGSDVAKFAAKQFIPFSVSGGQKLAEEQAPAWKRIMPYFGFTPVPQRLTMSASQELAAEIMAARMPAGARTKEQFDESRARSEIVDLLRRGQVEGGIGKLGDALDANKLTAPQLHVMMNKLKWTPYQFQVHTMGVDDAMRVWRIATADERASIAHLILAKVAANKSLKKEDKQRLEMELLRPMLPTQGGANSR